MHLRSSDEEMHEPCGLQNSSFVRQDIEFKLAKLAQIHLTLEHLLLIQLNINLENGSRTFELAYTRKSSYFLPRFSILVVYSTFLKDLQMPPKSFNWVKEQTMDKRAIVVSNEKILTKIEKYAIVNLFNCNLINYYVFFYIVIVHINSALFCVRKIRCTKFRTHSTTRLNLFFHLMFLLACSLAVNNIRICICSLLLNGFFFFFFFRNNSKSVLFASLFTHRNSAELTLDSYYNCCTKLLIDIKNKCIFHVNLSNN